MGNAILKKVLAFALSLTLIITMAPIIPGAAAKASAAELLPAPTIKVDENGVATWTEVAGASEYSVTLSIGGGWNNTRSYNIPENLAGWNKPAGTYTFCVYAVDSSGNQISEEAEITYEYTPTHTHIWSDEWTIEGAYHWHECTAEDCPVDVDRFKDGWAEHEYNASGVCVCGNELAIKPAPTITVDENGVATWTEVVGAADYSCDIDVGNSIIDTDEERSFDIKGWLGTNEKEAGVYTLSVYARNSSTETCSEVAKAYYAYNVEVIDRLNIDYTTDKANPSATECDLVQELRDVDGATISNGTKNVGYCQNVYLFSYTEPDRGGIRTQIDNENTDFIDPNLYYYALFEINARSGFDFMHDGTTFDTSSVKIFINGVETSVLWDEYYNEYWNGIEFYVPIEIDTSNKVYSVEITNSETNVAKNSTLQMNKNIASYGEGYDAVTWSVEGAEKAGTTISETGMLTVAADETATKLTVKATATKDSTKFDTITLNVVDEVKIESVSITPSVTSDFVREGHQFTATVIGNDALDVIWTLEGNTSSDTKITPNAHTCYLEIGKYETAETLTLKATSVKDPTKSATATITVKQSNIIDKLYIDYTTDNFYVGNTAYELLKELSAIENTSVSNGTEDVGTVFNVYLNSNTEADGSGEDKPIGPDDTDLIDPDLYYFATFEIRAKIGFDFKHDGETFDTSSLDVFVNETEMDGVAEAYYNDYWGIIDIVVPLKFDIADTDITLAQTSYTYDGTAKTPEVTVEGLEKDVDYKVSYSNNTNAGTGKVIVEGIGNYGGTLTKNFTIAKQSSSKCKASLSTVNYTYNGKAKTPSVTVKNAAGATLKNGTDYTVSYASGRAKIGRYKVTVNFKGNYTGSTALYFMVGPKNTSSVKTALYGYDDVKITWKKVSGVSGYKVYYKTPTSGYKLLKTTKSTSYKKKNLSDGVKYTFKVVAYKKAGGYNCENAGKTSSIYTLKKIAGVKAVKSGSKVKVSWTNISGETGYQISQSTSKSKTKIVSTYKTTSGKSKNISAKKGKTYYYKVRAYKTIKENGKTKSVYGPWSYVKAYKRK